MILIPKCPAYSAYCLLRHVQNISKELTFQPASKVFTWTSAKFLMRKSDLLQKFNVPRKLQGILNSGEGYYHSRFSLDIPPIHLLCFFMLCYKICYNPCFILNRNLNTFWNIIWKMNINMNLKWILKHNLIRFWNASLNMNLKQILKQIFAMN